MFWKRLRRRPRATAPSRVSRPDLSIWITGRRACQPSDLVLIAARPSMGKTAFVLNVVEHVAVKKGLPCMVFSLEMSKEQLVNRMLSMESNVDSQKLRTGTLTDSDWDAVVEGIGRSEVPS